MHDRLDIGRPINTAFWFRWGVVLTAMGLLMLGGALHIANVKFGADDLRNAEVIAQWRAQ